MDKKLAKRFEKERNMDKFIRIVSDVDKSEYKEFADMNRLQLLKLSKLDTSRRESKSSHVNVVMTYSEYSACDVDLVYVAPYDESFWTGEAHYPPYVYNNKIQRALQFIDYSDIYYAYYPDDIPDNSDIEGYVNVRPVDMFNYFLTMYEDTFL